MTGDTRKHRVVKALAIPLINRDAHAGIDHIEFAPRDRDEALPNRARLGRFHYG